MNKNTITINCLAFQLSNARKKVQKWYEKKLERLGLNTSYVYVMEVIKEFGPSSLSLIAEKIELERATVSNLLGRMERDGFIKRLPGKERRSMEVILTQKGNDILDEALFSLQQADIELDELLVGNLDGIKDSIKVINAKL
ncbi:DNA-binding transcriptional regulator, MarR family [Virgibacillus subterraneus]|uniref:DNA-binding transcriptional regulator, MarR family n=1 Tax=Virgibacillus subterraneus TaxID=621109 RepID=A0A1H9ETT7_9BACI|nr:MarR family transcriptional regulator [Virgibacillus subterraneus]SEQ29055.1 DNA-binding transcriptional regulator, MarR family [Virgibacillus subterraneus]